MALSRGGVHFFITIGCAMFVLSAASFICACIAMSKLFIANATGAGDGFFGLYFIAPGVLCILSGCKQGRAVLGAGIATNTIGVIIAISGLIQSAVFWAGANELSCDHGNDDYYDYYWHRDLPSCSDVNTVRALHGTNTIVFAILMIISFVGSIYGCVSTCCTAQNYYTLASTSEPGQPNVLVMTTNQSSHQLATQGFQPQLYPQPDTYGQQENRGSINHVSSNNYDPGHMGAQLVNV